VYDRKYYHKDVCLTRDTAHTTSLHLGGDAGMAFEETYTLGNLLTSMIREELRLDGIFQSLNAISEIEDIATRQTSRTEGLVLQCMHQGRMHLNKQGY
jgi:2-polyprenyl-6-methoxyphenol hydroxylase-like FAD-dependent oxidoreductase